MCSAYPHVSANHKRLWNMDAKSARAWGLLKRVDKQKMCSRYYHRSDKQKIPRPSTPRRSMTSLFHLGDYNVAPTSMQPAIRQSCGSRSLLTSYRYQDLHGLGTTGLNHVRCLQFGQQFAVPRLSDCLVGIEADVYVI
jgi:hypothetical protein